MTKQLRAKQERIIEAVRQGLEGDAALEFVRQSGFAMTSAGIARHLRSMGGRGRVNDLIEAGRSNVEILESTFPGEDLEDLRRDEPPTQEDLFQTEAQARAARWLRPDQPLYETTKVAVRLPADLYEALRLAAKAEHKTQNQLVVEILTAALSRMPFAALEPVEE